MVEVFLNLNKILLKLMSFVHSPRHNVKKQFNFTNWKKNFFGTGKYLFVWQSASSDLKFITWCRRRTSETSMHERMVDRKLDLNENTIWISLKRYHATNSRNFCHFNTLKLQKIREVITLLQKNM